MFDLCDNYVLVTSIWVIGMEHLCESEERGKRVIVFIGHLQLDESRKPAFDREAMAASEFLPQLVFYIGGLHVGVPRNKEKRRDGRKIDENSSVSLSIIFGYIQNQRKGEDKGHHDHRHTFLEVLLTIGKFGDIFRDIKG